MHIVGFWSDAMTENYYIQEYSSRNLM
jgi:hypothetical protein